VITTITWVTVTFATQPESDATLERFYRKVHPGGPGWRAVAARVGVDAEGAPMPVRLRDWVAGCVLVYGSLFGVGSVIMRHYAQGAALLSLAVAAAWLIARDLRAYRI
jgi:hypothetical protein